MLAVHNSRGAARGRGLKGCPPHGPMWSMLLTLKEGSYVARCLACGLVGPERQDGLKAKLAFDQRWH
jgi:hypothetical protein